jgi:two-component system NtrC family sensor kinase
VEPGTGGGRALARTRGPPRTWTPQDHDFALSVATQLSAALEGRARKSAEGRYRLLGQATLDLLYDWGVANGSIEWSHSPGALGYAPGELQPSLEWWSARVHADDRERVTASLSRHVESGEGPWRAEYRFRCGDGRFAVVIDRGFLERDARAGTMMDITEQRELQARVQLSDRLASVGTLAAGVAHEINNPLAYVQVNLQYARNSLGGQVGPVVEALSEAAEGVERVRGIVRDLKTFSHPESDRQRPVDLRAVLETSLNIAAHELRHRPLLRRELSPPPPVWANEARLDRWC